MKKTLLLILTMAYVGILYAGTPIPLTEIPVDVSRVITEYFPESQVISAKQDTDNGKIKYEVKIQYKEIKLEVDVSPEGRILDVDTEN